MKPIDINIYNHLTAVIVIWIFIYCSDYFLTILGARLYASGANQFIVYEGSYELTPVFQRDVDRLRLISPRFLFHLVLSVIILALVWTLDSWILRRQGFFPLLIGSLSLREAAIFQRHLRSMFLYRMAGTGGGLNGRLQYRRWFILQISGVELIVFALFLVFLYLLYGGWFLLGGILACLVTGIQHLVWGIKAKRLSN